jgi:secondary thiamine-phosphate synthase enzyme
MVNQGQIPVNSTLRCQWVDITPDVQQLISKMGISNGICTVVCLHTTAAITINENADPDVGVDFFRKLSQIIPVEPYFKHREGNSDSHIKASLVGLSVQVPVTDGKLVLGTWQSVYFCEFDGPRNRCVSVTVIGE